MILICLFVWSWLIINIFSKKVCFKAIQSKTTFLNIFRMPLWSWKMSRWHRWEWQVHLLQGLERSELFCRSVLYFITQFSYSNYMLLVILCFNPGKSLINEPNVIFQRLLMMNAEAFVMKMPSESINQQTKL